MIATSERTKYYDKLWSSTFPINPIWERTKIAWFRIKFRGKKKYLLPIFPPEKHPNKNK